LIEISACFDDDLHVLVERSQEGHQPLDREAVELVVVQSRHFRLADGKLLGRCRLGQAPTRDDAVDGVGEAQFGLPLVGVRVTQIGEHVARAAGDRVLGLVHQLSASFCHGGPRNPVVRP
jgi:hypothetical protein